MGKHRNRLPATAALLARARRGTGRPGAAVFRQLGAELSRSIPDVRRPVDIAPLMGVSTARVRYESEVALGKLAWQLRLAVGEKPLGE